MKLKLVIFICLCLIGNYKASTQITVQSKAKVENINFGYVMESVIITYHLANVRRSEKFKVNLSIYNTKGEKISAKSLSGDIGENISGEGSKKITWNIHRDMEELDDNIYVVVEAELMNPKVINPIGRTTGLAYSTIYPGYGGYRITMNKIHLVKGIAGYGLIGTSLLMRGQASNTYDSYKGETDLDKRDEYYREVESQLKTSNILLIGAGLVWISDYLTVLIAKNKVPKRDISEPNISFCPSFSPLYSSPGISMRITF